MKFQGHAVMAENGSAKSLQRHPRGGRQRSFSLLQFDGEPDWQLALKGWRRPLNDDPRHLERLDAAIVAALQGDGIFTRLTPERMLKPACMLCGKGLKPCRVVPKFQGTATVINWNILDAVGLIAAKRMAEPWRWETAEPPPAGCPCSWSGSCSRKRTAARRRRSRRSRLTHGHSDEPASDPDPSPRTSRTPRPICPRHCAVKCTRP